GPLHPGRLHGLPGRLPERRGRRHRDRRRHPRRAGGPGPLREDHRRPVLGRALRHRYRTRPPGVHPLRQRRSRPGARQRHLGEAVRAVAHPVPQLHGAPASGARIPGLTPAPGGVKLALHIPTVGEFADPRVLADLAAAADERGWAGFFLWDHLLRPETEPPEVADTLTALAAVASATSRIRLGPMVAPPARYGPQRPARAS